MFTCSLHPLISKFFGQSYIALHNCSSSILSFLPILDHLLIRLFKTFNFAQSFSTSVTLCKYSFKCSLLLSMIVYRNPTYLSLHISDNSSFQKPSLITQVEMTCPSSKSLVHWYFLLHKTYSSYTRVCLSISFEDHQEHGSFFYPPLFSRVLCAGQYARHVFSSLL